MDDPSQLQAPADVAALARDLTAAGLDAGRAPNQVVHADLAASNVPAMARGGAFIIADLDSKPPIAYLETAAEGQITDT